MQEFSNLLENLLFGVVLIVVVFGIFYFGVRVFPRIGFFIDKFIFSFRHGTSLYDPDLTKETRGKWYKRFLILFISFFINFGIGLTSIPTDPASDWKESVAAVLSNKTYYLASLTTFLLLLGIGALIGLRLDRSQGKKKPFAPWAKQLAREIGFTIDRDQRSASQDDITLTHGLAENLLMQIRNPIHRSITFTLYDTHSLYYELGSYLQEKIRELEIPLYADDAWIRFEITPELRNKVKMRFQTMIEILRELSKELSYRTEAGFKYFH
ncbi:MAG: hypothetical protein HY459_01040 [Parcubacteria group bacterium]|nr:hypothetical protein [Parcubacteria group bacterium]